MAAPVPLRRRHGSTLAGHGGSLLGHLLRHGYLGRQEVRADRRGLCPHVLADRHRGRDHPGRGGRHRVAGAESVVQGCPQEIAAGPERAASHEIVTDHRAIRAPFRAPMIMDRGGTSYPDAPCPAWPAARVPAGGRRLPAVVRGPVPRGHVLQRANDGLADTGAAPDI